MDKFTREHFENWLYSMFRSEELDTARRHLLAVYAEDPERYDREGWLVLLRDAEAEYGNLTLWR